MSVRAKVAAIEISEDEVRLVVVKTGGRLPKVLELHACPVIYPQGDTVQETDTIEAKDTGEDPAVAEAESHERFDALVQAVASVVKQMRTRPAAYVLCAPSQYSIVRSLTIPFRGKRRVAAAVQFELEPYLAFPIEELIVDFITVQEVEGETEILTVGMRRAYLLEQLAVLEAAGVEPEGIGLDGIGLTVLWQAGLRRVKGLNAVVHVREGSAVFAIINGKNLAYFRHLSVSAAEVRENPVVLAQQIQNSVRAFSAGWRGEADVTTLTVTGMELFEEERALLEEELRMPVQHENLFERLPRAHRAHKGAVRECAKLYNAEADVSESETGTVPSEASPQAQMGLSLFVPDSAEKTNYWTAAVGVAMDATGGHYSFNFRKGDLAWPHLTRGVIGHVLFSSCLALLALVGVAWHYHEECKKNLDQAVVLQTHIEAITQEIDEMRDAGIDVPLELFSDPPLLDILAELGDKMPDNKVRITELKLARAGLQDEWITIAGEVKNEAVFAEVFAGLKQSPMFRIEDDPDYRMESGKSTFMIRLKRPEPISVDLAEEL